MKKTNNINILLVSVYIYNGKAYLPTKAQFESGIFVGIEPVYVTPVDKQSLVQTMRSLKEAGHKRLPSPKTRDEFMARGDPVLAATGVRSWKQLARSGVAYSITWVSEHVRIDMTRLNKRGIWEFDLSKTKLLPPDTSLGQIAEIILADYYSRPGISK